MPLYCLLGLIASLALYKVYGHKTTFPQAIIDAFPLADWINQGQSWLEDNLRVYTRAITEVVKIPLEWL